MDQVNHRAHTYIPLCRNWDFVIRFSGQIVSTVGSRVSGITLPLLVLALTRSAAQAGIVGALDSLPILILGLPAGALNGGWNRITALRRNGEVEEQPWSLWYQYGDDSLTR